MEKPENDNKLQDLWFSIFEIVPFVSQGIF